MSLGPTNRRLAVFVACLLLCFGGLLARAFYVQVLAAPTYKAQADDQHVRVISIAARRGVIYDRTGSELAVSRQMVTVFANPTLVKDTQGTARALSPLLGRSEADLLADLHKDCTFVYLARKLEPSVGERVSALNLAGVGLCEEDKRVYPKQALAPQVLGFVGTDNVGLAGLELHYDKVLSGVDGERQVVRDPDGNRLETIVDRPPKEGTSLTLTIDEDIQYEAEQALVKAVEDYGAKKACAIVLDPITGEIVAMANAPLFDANTFDSSTVAEEWRRNMAVSDQYEPGSTFKMVVAASALEAGLVTPETVFELAPSITLYDVTVGEAHQDQPAVRHLNVTDILAQSSNVGAITLGIKVGKERLVETIYRFGFTKPLEIDFPGEGSGNMPKAEDWSGTTMANVPIGQGISVTPLQLTAAYAAVANDGVLVQPHLVRDGIDPWRREVVSPDVASQLRTMLISTVESGTGRQAGVDGYEVAGKTGTAQKAKASGRGYDKDRYVSSFVGMIPADDPGLVILVVVDEPSSKHEGAYVAAPVFAKIADFAVKHLEIAP